MNIANLDIFRSVLNNRSEIPLVFYKDGVPILPGYHVTEVKHAKIHSLDCGHGTDEWTEIIVQLLDGSQQSSQGHMTARKFMGIVGSTLESDIDVKDAELYFEFAPKNGPLQRLRAISVAATETETAVELEGESAGCKPFLRIKAGMQDGTSDSGCCSSAAMDSGNSSGCCGGGENQAQGSACCG